MRTIVALLLAGALLPLGMTPATVQAAAPVAVAISDAIAPSLTPTVGSFTSASVAVPAGAWVTYLATTDPRLAGQAVQIWTRTRAGSWQVATTRSVATDGTIRYSTRVLAWVGIQARFAGGADFAAAVGHGRFATVSPDDAARVSIGCDAFTPSSRTQAGPISVARTVVALVDGTLVVTLCSNASTGFRWDPPVYDHAHLRLVSRSSAGPQRRAAWRSGHRDVPLRRPRRRSHPGSIHVQPAVGRGHEGNLGGCAQRPHVLGAARPVAVTCDAFAAATDASGRSFVARPVATRTGRDIVVTLCSNASTGFSWEPPVYDHAALRLVRVTTSAPAPGLVGAAGTETWTFRALTSGSHSVLFAYSRPWAGGEKGLWRLALTTLVRS